MVLGDPVAGLPEDGLGVGAPEDEAEEVAYFGVADALPPLPGETVAVDLVVHDAREPEPTGQRGGQILVLEHLRGTVVGADGFEDREGEIGVEAVARFLRFGEWPRIIAGCAAAVIQSRESRAKQAGSP